MRITIHHSEQETMSYTVDWLGNVNLYVPLKSTTSEISRYYEEVEPAIDARQELINRIGYDLQDNHYGDYICSIKSKDEFYNMDSAGIPERIRYIADALGEKNIQYVISPLREKNYEYTGNKSIMINTLLKFAPQSVIDYVLINMIASERQISGANLIAALVPDTDKCIQWLSEDWQYILQSVWEYYDMFIEDR